MQGVCAPSRSLEKFPFFFLFRRPFSILLTVAANWFCKEHSHTHQKQSSVMGFRQLSLTFYFCPLKGLKDYQSTGTILKPADWAWSLTFRDEYRQDNGQWLCIQQYRLSYQLLVKRTHSKWSVFSRCSDMMEKDYLCWLENLTDFSLIWERIVQTGVVNRFNWFNWKDLIQKNNPGSLGKHVCSIISAKWYYAASCTFQDTGLNATKVKVVKVFSGLIQYCARNQTKIRIY